MSGPLRTKRMGSRSIAETIFTRFFFSNFDKYLRLLLL